MVTERGGGSRQQEEVEIGAGGTSTFRLVEESVLGGPKSTVNAKCNDANHEGRAQYGIDVGEEDHDDAGEDKEA
ncbi:hypothetical protein RHMOL_Rhmol06G0139200 [Rhododendron molle]|uniref:Uncharacterized protein n=1 Tax=Rhododendron molle TaxID=49168 RepID=A0ACC0ND73_RHOML|nr:hypothetical protein RHMOL_Rhmol06G0139200 [Rhododendron molle]